MNREILQQVHDALINSSGALWNEYLSDWRHGIPTRRAQLDAKLKMCEDHDKAIDEIKAALAQPDATLIREGTMPDHIADAGKKVDHFADAGKPMQPEQEPVAKVVSSGEYDFPMLQWLSANHSLDTAIGSLLYASPPQRQPLTDAEIDEIVYAHTTDDEGYDIWCNGQGVARAIEAAHNIKAAP